MSNFPNYFITRLAHFLLIWKADYKSQCHTYILTTSLHLIWVPELSSFWVLLLKMSQATCKQELDIAIKWHNGLKGPYIKYEHIFWQFLIPPFPLYTTVWRQYFKLAFSDNPLPRLAYLRYGWPLNDTTGVLKSSNFAWYIIPMTLNSCSMSL